MSAHTIRFDDRANVQIGTSYTLVAADNGAIVTLDNAGAIALDLDTGLALGFRCTVIQLGAGAVTIGGTATLNHRLAHVATAGQYARVEIEAYATDTYLLSGDTA